MDGKKRKETKSVLPLCLITQFHKFKLGSYWPTKRIHPSKKKKCRLIFYVKTLVFLYKLQSHMPHRNSIPTCTRQDYQHNLLLQLIKTLLLLNWPDVAHFNQIKLPKDQPVLLTVASDQAVCLWSRQNVLNLTLLKTKNPHHLPPLQNQVPDVSRGGSKMESDRKRRREEASCFSSLPLLGLKSHRTNQNAQYFKHFSMELFLSELFFRNATFIRKDVKFRQSHPQDDQIT